MSAASTTDILKGVSRSFYLSLRLLPAPVRHPVSLAYLLARTSDTIADTEGLPVDTRLPLLDSYEAAVLHDQKAPVWPRRLLEAASSREAELLEKADAILENLKEASPGEGSLIRGVVSTIIGGQRKDLLRFGAASPAHPAVVSGESGLEDYTWSVAGCVGEFWTKMGFLKMGAGFSDSSEERLVQLGIEFGKGLQLVNILRDLPRDLDAGRCYLPVNDPRDRDGIMREFHVWHARARSKVEAGLIYASEMKSRRMRMAAVLPALLAIETLDLLERASWDDLGKTVKVPRRTVYRLLAESLFY